MATDSEHRETRATGYCDERFGEVRTAFDEMLAADGDFSAQFAAVWRGQVILDLVGGPRLSSNSITGVFSSTKGVAATVIGLLLDRQLLDLDSVVARYWPEFASSGKGAITVRQLLCHQAGVIGVKEGFSSAELADSSRAAARLASAPPVWEPGTAHGYHAITIGVLMEELTRRVTGTSLAGIFEAEVRAPRAIDFYLGLPETEESRYVPVQPPSIFSGSENDTPLSASDTIQSLAFNVLGSSLPPDGGEMGPNNQTMRASGFSAIDGIGSARGLADVYSAVLGGPDHEPLVSVDRVEKMSRQHSFGLDRVLGFTTSFGLIYMKPHPMMEFGSFQAFGHDGAGGALGFADPLHDLAFGYIPVPMSSPGGADAKAVRLSQLVRNRIQALLS